jgi:hypothetical protein
MRGNDLLRVKRIVNVVEHPSHPVVIHGVQHIFQPPVKLKGGPAMTTDHGLCLLQETLIRPRSKTPLRVFEHRRAKRVI